MIWNYILPRGRGGGIKETPPASLLVNIPVRDMTQRDLEKPLSSLMYQEGVIFFFM